MNNSSNQGSNAQSQFNDTSLPRGYRNNNPLNIRKSAANVWKGKVVPGTDSAFEQFITMAYGYRAALYLLRKYIGQGHNTIRKIINKWAPPSENNTTSYVSNVSSRTGLNADTTIDRNDREKLCKIAYAMAWSENGRPPASMEDIYAGWNLL
ncbi:MAG: structural protein P5 [Bacteroidales bacterium]|nr:structural protein P5 [Bacteroidales bacterium]